MFPYNCQIGGGHIYVVNWHRVSVKETRIEAFANTQCHSFVK